MSTKTAVALSKLAGGWFHFPKDSGLNPTFVPMDKGLELYATSRREK